VKIRISGKNPDGKHHILYTPEGMSNQLLEELWSLSEDKAIEYPISLKLGTTTAYIEDRSYLLSFLCGLQTGFEMNRVF
jgi:hypothetical protein